MRTKLALILVLGVMAAGLSAAGPARAPQIISDTISTSQGPLTITFVGHGSLYFTWQGKVVHLDPWSQAGDYAALPKGDLILITHEHRDHADAEAFAKARKPDTVVIGSELAVKKLGTGGAVKNGERGEVFGVAIEAVPAYNLVHMREPGVPYHPKGDGNGYVLTFGDKRVYVAGDSEDTPEMRALKDIDVAFLPMNLPFTMTPEMVAAAAKAFKPRLLYPYHTGETDLGKLAELMRDTPGVELRLRAMK
jgi:L-ascorbate metabolism protein UlaG (beta-lactamase superfamily)